MQISIGTVALSLAFVGITIWGWRTLNWVWLRPKKIEKLLRQQGLKGSPYQLLVGDMKKQSHMVKRSISKTIDLADNILPHVVPFIHETIKYYGKNCFTWFGPIPRVMVMDPEHIKEALTKIYDFQKPNSNPHIKLLMPGLISLDGQKWAKHRKIINPAFHIEKLKIMEWVFYQSCSHMISQWEKLLSGKRSYEVDVWPYLVDLTSDVISRATFGSSHIAGRKIFKLLQEKNQLIIQATVTHFVPGWSFLPTKLNRKMKEVERRVQDCLIDIINQREKEMKGGDIRKDDLLGILLESNFRQIQEHGDNKNIGLSIKEVIEECKIFYLAGQETTSVLLVWTLILLAKHQNWQSQAREEILQVFGQNKPDYEGLNRLKIMTMVLNEVLRLYPPASLIIRAIKKDMKLGNITLPAGTEICIPTILIQHDTELWGEDATQFRPERFADGISKATQNQISYLPFGYGPRICIGRNFALAEVKMALCCIFRQFSVELSPSYSHSPYSSINIIRPEFGAQLILHKL